MYQRQTRAGHDEQGSVIKNNIAFGVDFGLFHITDLCTKLTMHKNAS